MGCGPSNAAVPVTGEGVSTISKLVYPRPEAFEIPLGDSDNPESLIKKHPPRRLKRLEEQSSSTPSIEDLEEKLATAESRRQQFLANRSQKTTFDKASLDATDNDASTIPEEGEDDRSTDGTRTNEQDGDDSGVERSAPPDGSGRRSASETEDDERQAEQYDRRRRGSDLSIGHLTSMRMKMNQYRKKSHH
ncbi:uncharacterized protein LOC126556343 [Anopheles maculipalpis]|uniref:uncharacterized protein LOC126556343 n=1 Tax=Anopheles maculipalpis TaxID=1496333 RepID=UPI002158A3C1|nr:uncharacterized protein LOC126556343 [Anopheles maculipalpis]